MHIDLPASLRNLYALSSERLWFTLAVIGGLLLASKLVEQLLLLNVPPVELLGM